MYPAIVGGRGEPAQNTQVQTCDRFELTGSREVAIGIFVFGEYTFAEEMPNGGELHDRCNLYYCE